MYVLHNAGVAIDETAVLLGSSCKTPLPLQLYLADIKPLDKQKPYEKTD